MQPGWVRHLQYYNATCESNSKFTGANHTRLYVFPSLQVLVFRQGLRRPRINHSLSTNVPSIFSSASESSRISFDAIGRSFARRPFRDNVLVKTLSRVKRPHVTSYQVSEPCVRDVAVWMLFLKWPAALCGRSLSHYVPVIVRRSLSNRTIIRTRSRRYSVFLFF